jgi:hypothetical protein
MKTKTKPKKLAVGIMLEKPELEYILRGIIKSPVSCSRDYSTEELHDKVKQKLEIALVSFND